MTWFRVDDGSDFHEKVVQAGNEAWGAVCRAGAWASRQHSDGFVPTHVASIIASENVWKRAEAAKGAKGEHGLVERRNGGWQIHDFTQWNPSAAEVSERREELSEKRRKAGLVGNAKRWDGHRKRIANVSQEVSQTPRKLLDADLAPVPSRPDLDPDLNANFFAGDALLVEGGCRGEEGPNVAERPERPSTASVESPKRQSSKKQIEDLDSDLLTPVQFQAMTAIRNDASLSPIVRNPGMLARDLCDLAPGVDVASHIARAGAWLRANPTKAKKNGNEFLRRWLSKEQDRNGGRSGPHPSPPQRPGRLIQPPGPASNWKGIDVMELAAQLAREKLEQP